MDRPTWSPLPAGPFGVGAGDRGADPLWIWADATGFRDHGRGLSPEQGLWFVADGALAPRPDGLAFEGVRFTPSQWRGAGLPAAAMELALPVVPERPPRRRLSEVTGGNTPPAASNAETLVGIIDSGCPFAAPMIRDRAGTGTRVLALWDQDEHPSFTTLHGHGRHPGLAYGAVVQRDALNGLMRRFSRPDGSIDADLCYREADYDALRWSWSHGAAVMSLLFAAPPGDGRRHDAQPVDAADLVFVQMSRACVQDSTSAALNRCVVDGLRFIGDHVNPGVTRRVIVNISNGTSRTLHDGSSMIERALDAFIDAQAAKGIDAYIVVPIGNTNTEQRHASLQDDSGRLVLFVPPGCEMPQYVTVHWPAGTAHARLRITPPGGVPGTIACGEALCWPDPSQPACAVVSPLPRDDGSDPRSLIVFAPTASDDPSRALARHGRWEIRLDLAGGPELTKPVRFWISRNQRNPGALPRGRQADFVDWDEQHQPERYLRPTFDDDPSSPPPRNGIQRRGALNGMATGTRDGLVVVGAYLKKSSGIRPSDYSAAGYGVGSKRMKTRPLRRGPDVSVSGDRSPVLPGRSVFGNRAGEVVRVVGTSFAAPLVARSLANGESLPDPPPHPEDAARLGRLLP